MSRTHFQSFLFAGVLLVSVFVARPHAEVAPYRTLAEQIQVTSIAAPRVQKVADSSPVVVVAPETARTPVNKLSSVVQPPLVQHPALQLPAFDAHVIFARDLGSGAVLADRASVERWPIASLTKLMTAAVAARAWPEDRAVTITESAVGAEGNAGAFSPGEVFTARDLIAAMLVASSNDAAEAVADSFGRAALIDAMQVMAAELGMRDTSFFDPTGLSVLNQSTAYDLERLVVHIREAYPDLLALTVQRSVRIRELASGAERTLANTNRFAGTTEFRGGKTGFTDEASGNLISLFEVDGRTFLIIILGSEDRFGETEAVFRNLK